MNSKNIAVIIISLIVIVSGGLILIFNSQDNNSDSTELVTNESSLVEDVINEPSNPTSSTLNTDQNSDPSVVSGSNDEPNTSSQSSTQFQDGDYTQEDIYNVPRGGREDITVNLTLENDIVTDISVELFATSGQSKEHQDNFRDGFDADEFIGQNLEEVSLSRISGASLTTAAFNNAISSIQSDAS